MSPRVDSAPPIFHLELGLVDVVDKFTQRVQGFLVVNENGA
jgi:hypothetical protein